MFPNANGALDAAGAAGAPNNDVGVDPNVIPPLCAPKGVVDPLVAPAPNPVDPPPNVEGAELEGAAPNENGA